MKKSTFLLFLLFGLNKKFSYSFYISSLFLSCVYGQTQVIVIENKTISAGTHIFYNPDTIVSPGISSKPIAITGSAKVVFKSKKAIELKPGFSASPSAGGFFHAYIDTADTSCPVARFEILQTLCAAASLTFKNFTTGDTAGITYEWHFGDSTANSPLFEPVHIYVSPGTYEVELVVTNENGCTSIVQRSITVIGTPQITILASPSTTLHQGDNITLSAGNGFASYQWSTGETISAIHINSAGIYMLIVKDSSGCSAGSGISIKGDTSVCTKPFISEYLDGGTTSLNKVIELYNPNGNAFPLTNYALNIFYLNGSNVLSKTINLNGKTIPPLSTFVVADSLSDTLITNHADILTSLKSSGNNAVVFYEKSSGSILDVIGAINVSSNGTGWTIPVDTALIGFDLVRLSTIEEGDPDWWETRNQYTSFSNTDFSHLGSHYCTCSARMQGPPDIHYRFDSASITTSNGKKFLNFTLLVRKDDSTTVYFHGAKLYMKYDPLSFGANANVQIKRTSSFSSTAYNTFAISTPTAGAFTTTISANKPPGRTLLTNTFVPLASYSIEITNCNHDAGIAFDTTKANLTSYYWDDPGVNAGVPANSIFDNDLKTLTLCQMNIISFTSPVYPGAYYPGNPVNKALLTINGIGFGSTRGVGNVYFPNANNGGQNYISLNDSDFISWTDTKIEINMPSVIDTVYPTGKLTTPGGGIFYVKNNALSSANSPSNIVFPYAINCAYFPSSSPQKIRMDLANIDKLDSAAIVFQIDTSVVNFSNPSAIKVIKKAIKDWRCESLAYIKAGGTISKGSSTADDVSLISFTNSFSNPDLIAETTLYPNALIYCMDNNGNKHVFPKEIDIAILRNPLYAWDFDTTGSVINGQNDFYEMILHEIGHALQLKHANDLTKLMWWQTTLGSSTTTTGKYIDSDARDGAYEVVSISNGLNVNFIACSDTVAGKLILAPGNSCSGSIGISKIIDDSEFKIYPNPTSEGFTIECKTSKNTTVQFSLFDYVGKELQKHEEKLLIGEYQKAISMSQLSAGLYFFVVSINGQLKTYKVIKL